ncbi:hypothetical protein [Desulfomarina sp.]
MRSNPAKHCFFFALLLCLILHQSSFPGVAALPMNQEEDPQTVQKLLSDRNELEKSLLSCESELKQTPENPALLRKCAYLHYLTGWLYGEEVDKKKHFFSLLKYAKKAYSLSSEDYRNFLLLTVANAKTINYLQPGDQVRMVHQLVQATKNLLLQKHDDPDVYYLLGWLNFKVGQISSIRKFLASVLFGGLPENLTIKKGFVFLKRAKTLRPDSVVYTYDLGLFFLRTGQKKKALIQFQKAQSMAASTLQDKVYRHRATEQITGLNKTEQNLQN